MHHDHRPGDVRFPWRRAARTAIVATLALIPLLPELIHVAGIGAVPWVASVSATAAAISRVMSVPAFHYWLKSFAPWLDPEPYVGRHRLTETDRALENHHDDPDY